jgi:MFS family permease
VRAELGLSNSQWGLVGAAFQIASAVFEPTTGHWGDRHGSRRVLTRIVRWWSAFTWSLLSVLGGLLRGCLLGARRLARGCAAAGRLLGLARCGVGVLRLPVLAAGFLERLLRPGQRLPGLLLSACLAVDLSAANTRLRIRSQVEFLLARPGPGGYHAG